MWHHYSVARCQLATPSSDALNLFVLLQVPVMQSDLSFSLLYGTNLPESIIRAVPALLAEFPAGLLTPAGGCAGVGVRLPSQVAAVAIMT